MTIIQGEPSDNANPLPVDDRGAPNIASGRTTASGTATIVAAALTSGSASVSSEATLIVPARAGRKAVLLSCPGCLIKIGDETVTAETGYSPFSSFYSNARIETSAAIYGVLPSGTVTATIGEGGTFETITTTAQITYLELF
jgi:hypothetical protein